MFKRFLKRTIPPFLSSWYHFLFALTAAIIYRFPSKKIKVIGITGTNGKSTVVVMTSKILEEAGYKVAYLSSIKFKIGAKEISNTLRMTMPGRLMVQRFLRQAVDNHCQYAILEVTSEGIKQYRHRFISFKTAVLTNLSPEHIEAHGGFANYRQAKLELFRATKDVHIINLDDKNAEYFLAIPAQKKIGYTLQGKSSIPIVITAEKTEPVGKGLAFIIDNKIFKLKLVGDFNIYNALAAISIALSEDINLETCRSGLEQIESLAGRMEEVISAPFRVFVDYAFTPNALEKVYQTLKSLGSRLICVLGACGGGRDKWKRPVLGSLAAKYCDEIVITNEDPYDENPLEIIDQVASGTSGRAEKILDRREAINQALKEAKEKDIIVITGKGCEPSICLAQGKKIPWDDRQVVREEFNKLTQKDKS